MFQNETFRKHSVLMVIFQDGIYRINAIWIWQYIATFLIVNSIFSLLPCVGYLCSRIFCECLNKLNRLGKRSRLSFGWLPCLVVIHGNTDKFARLSMYTLQIRPEPFIWTWKSERMLARIDRIGTFSSLTFKVSVGTNEWIILKTEKNLVSCKTIMSPVMIQ